MGIALGNRHWTDEHKAQALALTLLGYSSGRIQDELGIPATTVRTWLQSSEFVGEQLSEIANQERRINVRLGAIVEERLNDVASGKEHVSFRDLMVSLGIGRSKEHERSQRNSPQGGVNVNITFVGTEPRTDHSARSHPVSGMELDGTVRSTKDTE